jgi:prepilin peptidase CpaA
MIAQILLLAVFPALLVLAAGWDLASYTIPNWLQVALSVAFLLYAGVVAMPLAVFGMHALAGLCALILGFALFAFGYIGGGDAKLFAATALWLGWHDLLLYALIASLIGGALALLFIGVRRLPLPAVLYGQGWVARLHQAKFIPYGVALAAGGLLALPQAEIFLRLGH